MPELSAIVPAADRPATLGRCVGAIEAADHAPEELIVASEPPGAIAGAARNVGAARATREVLVFVDADVIVHRDAFERIRAAFEADPGLTAVFGSYDDRPEAPGTVSAFRNLLHHHVHHSAPGPGRTFWAGLGAIRRDAFEAAGGFDETLPWVEDVELGARLARNGRRILLEPRIQGTHLKAWTLAEMVRTDFARRAVPWVTLLIRFRTGAGELNLGWRHQLSAAASVLALVSLARGRFRIAGAMVLALLILNRSFYALLLHRRGPWEAASGVALHLIHHVTSALAVPVGALLHLRAAKRGARGSASPRPDSDRARSPNLG